MVSSSVTSKPGFIASTFIDDSFLVLEDSSVDECIEQGGVLLVFHLVLVMNLDRVGRLAVAGFFGLPGWPLAISITEDGDSSARRSCKAFTRPAWIVS